MIMVRMDFIQDYTLKSLRLKQDKWNKLILSDGQREYMISFVERGLDIDNFPHQPMILRGYQTSDSASSSNFHH